MITQEQVNIYKKYHGDMDGLARAGSVVEKKILDYKTYLLLENLIQDIILIKNNVTSKKFAVEKEKQLMDTCENAEVIDAIYRLALSKSVKSI